MVITYHGAEFFKVSFGDTILAFNPISKESKLKQSRFGAHIALVSLDHPDFNGITQVTHGERAPFVVMGPGEYEVGGVLIRGYPTVSRYGGVERINTAYLVTMEGMLLLFLGAIATKELPADLRQRLDDLDIVFVPIGGEGVLEPDEAHELAVTLEPHVVIPMHFSEVGQKSALEKFLKEEGATVREKEEKLTVKRKDLEGKQNEIVVLAA